RVLLADGAVVGRHARRCRRRQDPTRRDPAVVTRARPQRGGKGRRTSGTLPLGSRVLTHPTPSISEFTYVGGGQTRDARREVRVACTLWTWSAGVAGWPGRRSAMDHRDGEGRS